MALQEKGLSGGVCTGPWTVPVTFVGSSLESILSLAPLWLSSDAFCFLRGRICCCCAPAVHAVLLLSCSLLPTLYSTIRIVVTHFLGGGHRCIAASTCTPPMETLAKGNRLSVQVAELQFLGKLWTSGAQEHLHGLSAALGI